MIKMTRRCRTGWGVLSALALVLGLFGSTAYAQGAEGAGAGAAGSGGAAGAGASAGALGTGLSTGVIVGGAALGAAIGVAISAATDDGGAADEVEPPTMPDPDGPGPSSPASSG